jgi:hypothetical protein
MYNCLEERFMPSGTGLAERRHTKSRRRSRETAHRSQTRKREHERATTPSPPHLTKKTFTVANDYVPRDQETEVPISSYQPLQLPVLPLATAGGLSNASISNGKGQSICYKLLQSETKDTFIAKLERYGVNNIEIAVGGSIRSLPKECVKINISTVRINDTETIVEAVFIVDYNERCNTEKNLKGALILARVAISFAYTYFRIDKFILRDQSKFHCKTSDYDYKFSLPGRELLKYGKTWYQRNLNAHIYHPQTLRDIQRYIAFANTKPPWSTFSHYPIAERLKPIWNKSASYKELVLTLLDDIQRVYPDSDTDDDTNQNCHILHPWFNNISYEYLQDLLRVDNFILRDGFPFVKGLKVEFIPENEVRRDGLIQGGGRSNGYDGWNDGGFWFTERIR